VKVHIIPKVDPQKPDPGDGGIGRVVRAQYAALPAQGWEVTDDPAEADVIHCHVEIPPAYLRLYGDKPFVVTSHGFYWTDGGYEWDNWCYTVNQKEVAAIRQADMVTTVSEWVAQSIRRNTAREVHVVHHGVDLDEWAPLPLDQRGQYVLWNKTRVDPICDPGPMNAAAALLPRVQFVSTFGNGAPNVEIVGRLEYSAGRELVRHAAVYLVTTRETWGIGTLEAMAAGIPVVGFAYGGQREIITHGHDGWLVQPGDVEGLAEGIEWALAHREEVGARARETAKRFTVEAAARQYAQLYSTAHLAHRMRQTGPRVSVIVPAYRMGDYLDACLASVAAQTIDDWECIVVNDASPDERDAEIAEAWATRDARFRHVRLAQNGYLANARNVGISHARGRYIFPLDADDQITPGTLATLAAALDGSRDLDIAYGNVRFVHEDGRTDVVYPEARERGYPSGHSGWPVRFKLDWMLSGPGQLLPYASMYRRRVWALVGGYRTRCRSSEDQEFWLRTASYGFPAQMVTNEDTLVYRVRGDSMSATEGWEEHRGWFPWVADRSLIPGGAVQEGVEARLLPFPAYDPAPVAVVIPVGPGHAQHLQTAVDSVDAQTFRNWECIVVNDTGAPLPNLPSWVRVVDLDCEACSGAGDEEVPWSDDPDRGPRFQPCSECGGTGYGRFNGAAAARNAGIASTTAPLFLPLDADDYLQPRAIEILLDNYMGGEEPAVIYSDFWEDPEGELRVFETPDYDPRHLIRRGALHGVTALTPRRFWEEVGGYDESVAWEDWVFSLAISAKGHCSRRVALPLFTYRKHTGMRREQNYADFEASKASIMQKDFGITRGGETLACSRCSSGKSTTSTYRQAPRMMAAVPGGGNADMRLVRYIGARSGDVTYRSRVDRRATYRFSTHNPERYVLAGDAEWLLGLADFTEGTPAPVMAAAAEERPLVAARAPSELPTAAPAVAVSDPPPWGADFLPTATLPDQASTPEDSGGTPVEGAPTVEDAAVAEVVPQGERPISPEAVALAEKHNRAELDAMAKSDGIENAESLRTKGEVAQAIIAIRRMLGS